MASSKNKIRESRKDRIFKSICFFFILLWVIVLLFPIYWLLTSSVKDQAAAMRNPPDFVPVMPNEYVIDIEGGADYDFTEDAAKLIWYVGARYTNANMGKLTVRQIAGNRVVNKASVSLRVLNQYRYSIFPGEVSESMLTRPGTLADCVNVLKDANAYSGGGGAYKSYKSSETTENMLAATKGLTILEGTVLNVSYSKSFSSLFNNYYTAWTYYLQENGITFGRFLLNSAVISVAAILIQWVVSALAAYALSKMLPRLIAQIAEVFFIAVLMIPGIVYTLPLYLMVSQTGLLSSPLAVILPGIPNAIAIVLFKSFFDNIPNDMVEAAKIDGAPPLRIFMQVIMPLSFSVFGVIAILVFTSTWNDYMWPMMVLKDIEDQTFPIIVSSMTNYTSGGRVDYTISLAMSVIASLPTLLIFLLFQKQMQKGLVFGGLKG